MGGKSANKFSLKFWKKTIQYIGLKFLETVNRVVPLIFKTNVFVIPSETFDYPNEANIVNKDSPSIVTSDFDNILRSKGTELLVSVTYNEEFLPCLPFVGVFRSRTLHSSHNRNVPNLKVSLFAEVATPVVENLDHRNSYEQVLLQWFTFEVVFDTAKTSVLLQLQFF